MSSVVAIVKSIVGQVIAVSPEGIRRVLIEGDRLLAGEEVLTGPGGAVTLELADGRLLDLGRDTQWSADAPDSSTDLSQATAQAAPSVEELQQAIAAGADPTTELEATAAGPAAAGGGAVGGGHSFVMLQETAGAVDPTIGFPTGPLAFNAGLTTQEVGGLEQNTSTTDTPFATGVALSATPSITEAGGVIVYTATVGRAPLSDLTITLSNGSVIVIPAGQTSGAVNVVIAPNDTPYIDAGQIVTTITGTSGGNGLVVTPSTTPAVTQVTDTIDTTTVVVTADPAKEGDANVTFHFQLSNPPQAGSTTTLTVNVGGTDYTVKVDATGKGVLEVPNTNGEDVYKDGTTVTAEVTAVNGGNFEEVDLSKATATADVKDTIDTTTVVVTADPAKEGDANVTFHFQLSNPPQAGSTTTLTVNVGGTDYTVKVDATGKGVLEVPNTNGEDVYKDGTTVTAEVTAVNGGNFEAVDLSKSSVTAEVKDTIDTTTVVVTADPAKEGDANVTFHFQLSNPPQAGSATTLTVNVGGTDYTVKVDATGKGVLEVPNTNGEDVYKDGTTVTAEVTAVNGGNFEEVDLSKATATADVKDTIDTTTVVVTADPAKEGDANVTFHFQLSNPPQAGSATTLTVNVGGTDYTVKVDATGKGVLEVPNTNLEDVYKDASTVTAEVTAVNGGNFEAVNLDNATHTVTVEDTITPEGTTTVVVTADPAKEGDANVTFHFQLSNPPQAGSATTLTVNVGGTDYTVKVDATGKGVLEVPNTNGEDVYKDGTTVTAEVTAVNGGNFEAVDLSKSSVTAEVKDTIDTTTVVVTADPAKEGDANVTFHFQLSNPPQAGSTTTLTVNVGGTDYTVKVDATGKGVLEVPNTNGEDVYKDGTTVTAEVTAVNGGNFEAVDLSKSSVTAEVKDTIDTTTVVVTADPAKEGDANVTFHFQLSNPPQAGSATTLTVNVGGTDYTVKVDATGKGVLEVPNTNGEDVYKDGTTVTAEVTAVNGGNFEAVDLSKSSVTAEVKDTIDTTTVVVTADPAKEGDANVTFHFQLSNPPQAGSATTLTVNVGGTDYTVKVDATGKGVLEVPNTNGEDVYKDGTTVTAEVTAVNGGNFEEVDLSKATATADVKDTIDTTTVVVTADPAKEGDANVTFHFQLSNPPQAGSATTLTVNVGGTDYTVKVDATGKGVLEVPNTNGEDVYKDGTTVTAEVTAVNGGNFEEVDLSKATATADVKDTIDTTTVVVTADPAKEGDANVTFHFQLSNPPQAGSTTTLTVNVGGTDYTVKVDAAGKGVLEVPNTNGEDVYKDGTTVTAEVTAVNGGNFEEVDLSKATATADVKDTIDTTTVVVTADPAKEGDANVTFHFQLSNPPQAGSTTTLTVNVGGTDYTVKVDAAGKGVLEVPNTNLEDVYKDASTVTAEVTAVNGGNFEAVNLDNATHTVTVEDTITPEGTTTVVVTADPAKEGDANVTFHFQLSNPPQAGSTTTLTVNVGGTDYTVKVDATGKGVLEVPNTNGEDVYKDGSTVTAEVTAVNGGNFEAVDLSKSSVTAEVKDTIDTTTVTVTADPAKEGDANVTFHFQLSNPPQAGSTTTLTVNVGGTDYTVKVDATGKGVLEVPNTNGEDVYKDGTTVTAEVTAVNGGNFEEVDLSKATATADVKDTIDITTVVVTADPAKEGDANVTFHFQLSNPPQAGSTTTLTVNVGGTDYTVKVDATGKGVLEVPNTNGEDVYKDGTTVTAEVTAVNGGNFEEVDLSKATATADVKDTIDTTTVVVTADPAKEGDANVTFHFQLSNPPQAGSATTLTVNVGGTDYTVKVDATGKGVLEVPNTNLEDVYKDASTVTAEVTAVNGGNFEAVNLDNATHTVTVEDTITPEGTTTVVVTADPAKEGDANVTFHFQLSNPPQAGSATTLTVNVGGTDYTVKVDATGKGVLEVPNTNGEDVYKDGTTVTAEVTAVNGGNFEAVDLSKSSVTAEVKDTIDTTTVTVTADPAKEGDANVTFHFQLSNPPQAGSATTLTVNVGGTDYTVKVDATGKGVLEVPNTNGEDVYKDGTTVTAEVTAVNGGNFEEVDLSKATATADVKDTIDTTTVVVTADPAKEGDANVTFHFQLSNPPQAGSATTLTVNVGGTDYTVKVDATGKGVLEVPNTNGEDVYKDGTTVTAEVTAVNGGNFEEVDLSKATATADVKDTIDTTTVVVTADPAKEGDANVTFHFQLSNPPQAGSTTTLTVNVGGTDYTVKVDATGKGVLEVPNTNGEDVYKDGTTVTAEVTAVNGGNFEEVDLSKATATADVKDTIDTTTVVVTADPAKEGDANVTFHFQLSNPPQAGSTTTLTVNVGGTDYTVKVDAAGKGVLEVPNTNGEDVYKDGTTVTAEVTAVNGGNFEEVDLSKATATADVKDTIDTTTVVVTADPAKEGDANVTFHFQLSNPPQAGSVTTLTVNVGGTDYTVKVDATGKGVLEVPNTNGEDVYKDGTTVTAEVTAVNGGNFEEVDLSKATATADVKDTIDTTTVTVTADPAKEGDANVTFHFQLSNPPQAGSTTTLTVNVGGTDYTVKVDATGKGVLEVPNTNGEDVYKDGTTVTAEVTAVNGGNFEEVDLSKATATADVKDTIDTTTVVVTADPAKEGDANVTFHFQLSNPPQAGSATTLTVNVGGTDYTVKVDATGKGVLEVPNTNGEDVYKDGTTVTAEVTAVNGGNFEEVDLSKATATADVKDTIDTTTVVVTADPAKEGDANVTFHFQLSNPPQAGSTTTLTVNVGGTDYTVKIDATGKGVLEVPNTNGEDVYKDGTTVTAEVTAVNGGNFEEVDLSKATATADVKDTIDTTTVVVTADPAKEGDANVTFHFQLSNPPQAGSTTTLTVNVGGTDYTVKVDATGKGVLEVPNTNGEDVYKDGTTVTAEVTAVNGGNFEEVDLSKATATADVKDTIDTTTVVVTADPAKEGDANVTFHFQLSNPPQAGSATTLTVNVGGTDYTVKVDATGKGVLEVPNTNGEDVYKDGTTVTAEVTAVNGGNFEEVDLSKATATADVKDTIDTTTVVVTADPAKEGDANVTFHFQLSNPPQAGSTTTLTVNVGGTDYTVKVDATGKGVLEVPNTNGEDVYKDGTTVTAEVTAVNGGNFEEVDLSEATATADVKDTIDTTTVTVTADPAKEGDANVTFHFQLSNPPQAGSATTLTVNVGGTDYTVKVDATGKGVLEVPNTNGEDVYKDGTTVTAEVTAVNGGNFEEVDLSKATATADVKDTIDTTTVAVTADPAKEGDASITFHFQLSNPPQTGSTTTLTVDVGGVSRTVNIDATGKGTLVIANTNGEDVYLDASSVTAKVTAVNGGNFENVSLTGATATAEIKDTLDTTTVAVTADPAKEGDANVTFHFQLSNPPQAGSATTLTVNVGGTDYTVKVDAAGKGVLAVPNTNGEDVYKDGSTLTATVTKVDGGNFEAVDLSKSSVTAEIKDTIDTTTVAVTADPAKEGDANITFHFQLSNPPQTGSTTTLTVDVGGVSRTVNIDATGKGTLVIANTNGEDVYLDASSVTAKVTAVNGGNFENVSLTGATATAEIKDTIDTTTVNVTADPAKEGDANVTFNFQLSNPPQAGSTTTLTVNVAGTNYTVKVDASGKGTLAVPNPNGEDVYNDASTLKATVTAVNGGNFENVSLTGATATANIADTIDTTTVAVTANPAKEGDATVTFNFQLSNPPQAGSNTTLTVNVAGTNYTVKVDASGKGTLAVPNPNGEDVYNDASTLKATVTAVNGGNFENVSLTGATATAEIKDTIDTTTVAVTADPAKEGDANITFHFQLSNPPQTGSTTTLTVDVGGVSRTVNIDATGKGTLVIANTNGEDVYLDASSVTAKVTAVNGGNFENVSLTGATATAEIKDTIDTTTVAVTANPAKEGDATVTFNFQLSNPPQAGSATTLTVNVAGTNYTVKVDASGKGTLAVPNPNGEDVYNDASTLKATVTAVNGGNFENVSLTGANATANIADTLDTTTVAVTANPAKEGDANVIFNFQLSNPPQSGSPATLTVNVAGTNYTVNLDATGKGTLAVPNPNGEDVYNDASTMTATVTAINGGNFEATSVTGATAVANIADTIDTTTLSITGTTAVAEGGNATYTLTLTSPAKTDVTVKLSYTGTATNGADYTGVTTVTIKAGSSTANFTIPTLKDNVTEGTEQFTVKVDSATGGNFEKLEVSGTAGSVTTQIFEPAPVLDLDANDSSGKTGADYQTTFTENQPGSGVSIGDVDVSITDFDSSMLTGATVILTNRQPGDALNLGNSVGGITINANSTDGKVVLTLSGNASLADYIQAIKNITFINTSEDPSTTPRIITVTVTDGVNTSNTATTTVNVIAVNDAPVSTGGAVTGQEDTDLVLGWNDFNVRDVDSPTSSLGITITKLPDAGTLKLFNGTSWVDVKAGQTISQADIDAGKLKFVPLANQSGIDGYGGSGVGNKQADYAQIKYKPTDGKDAGSEATLKVDIAPVADKPDLSIGSNNVNSLGLTKETWTSLTGLGTNGNGITGDALKNVFANSGNASKSELVNTVDTSATVTPGTGSKTSGLIYLEAGKTYTFSGTADDSLQIVIGGKNVAGATWGSGSGSISGSFTPTTSGYYTLEIYNANQAGPGSLDINIKVGNGAVTDLSSANIPMYPNVGALAGAGVTVSDLHGSNGQGYYDGYKLNEGGENGAPVKLVGISTGLTDTDGSESLNVKLSGIPAGSVVADNAGHTFTVGSSPVDVTGWNLGSLTIKPPAYYAGQFDVKVTSTSTESVGGSTATSEGSIKVTVYPQAYTTSNLSSDSDNITGTDGNDIIVADVSGLHVVPGQDYNIAFIVDTSGSMGSSGVNAAKSSLESVFKTLAASVKGSQSGTVNILLVDFATQVKSTVSVTLNDAGLQTLLNALNGLKSNGGTNYEDAFKTTANWFQNLKDAGSTGSNQTFFITDGQPTYYQTNEQGNPKLGYSNVNLDTYLSSINYKMGDTVYRGSVDSSTRVNIDSDGSMTVQYKYGSSWYNYSSYSIHAQGDGTYELSTLAGTGNSTDKATTTNSTDSFKILAGLSDVEAIGLNNDVKTSDLKPYDTDGKPQTNIDPSKLADAILGHTEVTQPGNDTVNGGDGNDIIFGDLLTFPSIAGTGVEAIQGYVASKLGVDAGDVDARAMHKYVSEHYTEFDVSGANDGADTLMGGAGNDIIFGQGGNDLLDGGKGNDILLGGSGNDTLIGGQGNDILIGGSGADTFVWKAGDLGNDVIKDFKSSEGDRLDLRDLLQGEKASTIDNFLKITTVDGSSTLQVSTEGKLNAAGGLANADVTIKLEGVNWSNTTINSLISGADPTIKIDNN
nr:immunoglobulin-like domain-containing protein [uncultured Pseudomonas sp.]